MIHTRTLAFNVIAWYLAPVPFIEENSLSSHGLDLHDINQIEIELQEHVEKYYPHARNININSDMNLDFIDKIIRQSI